MTLPEDARVGHRLVIQLILVPLIVLNRNFAQRNFLQKNLISDSLREGKKKALTINKVENQNLRSQF